MAPREATPAMLEVDKAMQAWFSQPTPIAERKPFNESDLRDISNVLRSTGREAWSRVPRLYATLRSINQLPLIDVFLTQGLSDVWFPFSHRTLPDSVRSQTARNDFIEAQRLVLTKSLDLEKEDGKHKHFMKQEDIPMVKLAELGRGGFGVVEKVISTISYKEYARKLIPRGPTFRKNREVLRDFEMELATLKKLSHIHIVEFVGSYTDPRYVGILISPVAECNLKEYLERPLSEDMSSLLRTSFGCLVAAVNYLHQNRIRHKDIKPPNILIQNHKVLVTDFGISRDWGDYGQSTTTGPTTKTMKYCAPEVAACKPRNSLADIWSLGCVFLEVWTVLCGESVSALAAHLTTNGSKSPYYHDNIAGVRSWRETLIPKIHDPGLKPPEAWICTMLEIEQEDRCNAQSLFDMIQDYSLGPDARHAFVGLCCTEQEDTEESVLDSDYEPDLNLTTTDATTISSAVSHESLETRVMVENSQNRDTTNQLLVEDVASSATTPPADLLALEQISLRGSEGPSPIEPELDTGFPTHGFQLPRTPPANVESSVADLQPRDVSTPVAPPDTPLPVWDFSLHHSENQKPGVLPGNEATSSLLPRNHNGSEGMDLHSPFPSKLYPVTSALPATPKVPMTGDAPSDTASLAQNLDSFQSDKMGSGLLLGNGAASEFPLSRSSSPRASAAPITLKVLMGGKSRKLEMPFFSLHSGIFFDTLRNTMFIPSDEPFTVKRWSDSGATWMVLDPQDQETWKQMLRAAKAKLKLRLLIVRTTHANLESLEVNQGDQAPHDTARKPLPTTQSDGYFSQDPSHAPPLVSVKLRFENKLRKFTVPMDEVSDPQTLFTSLSLKLDLKAPEGLVFERYSDSANSYTTVGPIAASPEYRQLVRAAKAKMKLRMRAHFGDDPRSIDPLVFRTDLRPEPGNRSPPASPV